MSTLDARCEQEMARVLAHIDAEARRHSIELHSSYCHQVIRISIRDLVDDAFEKLRNDGSLKLIFTGNLW